MIIRSDSRMPDAICRDFHVLFFPEKKVFFTLKELKEVVKEMEKLDTNANE